MVKPTNPNRNQSQSTSRVDVAPAPAVDVAPAPAVDVAPAPAAPTLTAEQRLMAEHTECLSARDDARKRLVEGAATLAPAAIGEIVSSIAKSESRISEIESALSGVRFVPAHDAALDAALANGSLATPKGAGRIQIATIYDLATGKRVESKIVMIATASERKPSVGGVQRANLRASGMSVDLRIPSAGFSRMVESHGVSWKVSMLGGNSCRADAIGHESISGSIGMVVNKICQGVRNAYAVLGLGEPGSSWSDATPCAHWTKA